MEKNIKQITKKFLLFLLTMICLIITFSLCFTTIVEAYDNGSQYEDWRYDVNTRRVVINYI